MSSLTKPDGRRYVWLGVGVLALIGASAALGAALDPNQLLGAARGSGFGGIVALLGSGALQMRWSRQGGAAASCAGGTPAARRLGAAISYWMAVYVAAVVLISWVFDLGTWPYWARAIAAIMPALPIGGVIYALIRHLSVEPDEYQRLLTTRAVLISAGVTFFIVTAWGFLEVYVDAPHFPTLLIMVPFWLVFGVAMGVLRSQNR